MKLMRDDNDGFSVLAHAAEDAEKVVRFLRRQDSCRLIEDQEACAAVEHFNDLDRLLF